MLMLLLLCCSPCNFPIPLLLFLSLSSHAFLILLPISAPSLHIFQFGTTIATSFVWAAYLTVSFSLIKQSHTCLIALVPFISPPFWLLLCGDPNLVHAFAIPSPWDEKGKPLATPCQRNNDRLVVLTPLITRSIALLIVMII